MTRFSLRLSQWFHDYYQCQNILIPDSEIPTDLPFYVDLVKQENVVNTVAVTCWQSAWCHWGNILDCHSALITGQSVPHLDTKVEVDIKYVVHNGLETVKVFLDGRLHLFNFKIVTKQQLSLYLARILLFRQKCFS